MKYSLALLPIINAVHRLSFCGLAATVFALSVYQSSGADVVPPAASAAPIRLAVLAEDISLESRVLADLLTVELAAVPNVQTVERAEIERVLDEQKLTAEGLAEASTRVHLGRTLRAAGLVFVQREAGGNRLLIRLAETRRGYVAGFSMAPAGDVVQPAAIAAELSSMLPKLALVLSQQTAVSLLRFSTALLSSDAPHPLEERFEALMVNRLMERLCKEPVVVVTERRRLDDVARERQWSAETGDLTSGALLIDGELATAARLQTPKGGERVTLTVRIRDLASGSQAPIVRTGARMDLHKLMADTVEAAADAVLKHHHAKQKGELPQGEAESLLFLARQKGLVWAGEAAYALDPTNKVVHDAYLKALLGEANISQRYRAVPRDCYLKMAFALARAEQVAREQGISLWAFTSAGFAYMRRSLEHGITHSDREIMQLLRPFRATMRRECEAVAQSTKDPVREGFNYATLVEWSAALYDTHGERLAFIQSLFDRVAREAAWEDVTRDFLVSYLLSQHEWLATFLAEQGGHSDPVRRFYGKYGAMRKTFDPPTQRVHAREALNALPDLLQHPGAFGSYLVLPNVGTKTWLSDALLEIYARYPEYAGEIKRALFKSMRELHDADDHISLFLLQPAVHLRGLPESEVVPWLEKVDASRVGAPQPEYLIGEMFKELATLRHEMKETPAQAVPPPAAAARFRREVLLQRSTVDPAWRMGGGLNEIPSFGPRGREKAVRYVEMYGPHRLLIDGDTLWIGVAGECDTRRRDKVAVTRNRCGLASYHLPTRTLRSMRTGWLESPIGPLYTGSPVRYVPHNNIHYRTPLVPLARWRDWIVMAYYSAGIVLFPVAAPAGVSDLSDAILIDTDTGLPVNEVFGWTTLDSTLYILLQDRFIMTWDVDTRALAMLFDNQQQITGVTMPEHDHFRINELWTDEATKTIFSTGRLWLRRSERAWYGSPEGSGCLTYHPASARWNYAFVKNMPTPPAPPVDPRSEARKALEAEGSGAILDVAIWQGRILALIAYNESWRIELVTEE